MWQTAGGEKKGPIKVGLGPGIGQIHSTLLCSDEELAFPVLIKICLSRWNARAYFIQ